jgi:hypothetical protein
MMYIPLYNPLMTNRPLEKIKLPLNQQYLIFSIKGNKVISLLK